MSKKATSRSRGGRPRIHDPAVIQRLLAERQQTGESYASLSARSGIPAGTLASWSHRQGRKRRRSSSFVELVAKPTEAARPTGSQPPLPAFEIALRSGSAERVVSVPPGVDPEELVRIIRLVEEAC